MTTRGPPAIRIKACDAKRRSECLPLQEGRILACAKHRRAEVSRVMIPGVPQPPLRAFATPKAPPFLHLGGLTLPNDDGNVWRSKRAEDPCMHLFDGRRFFLSTSMTVAGRAPASSVSALKTGKTLEARAFQGVRSVHEGL